MGGGRVGLNLATAMVREKFDVTLIEKNRDLCNNAASELDSLIIHGSGTEIKILEEANVSEADVFVAATGNDDTNLLACLMVKKYNPKKIIARISDPKHEHAFKVAGIDITVSPELTAVSYLEKLIIRPKIADMVILGKGNAELLNIPVENNKIIGKKIGEINPGKYYIICAIYKSPSYEIMIPEPNMVLEANDKISILIKTKHINKVMKIFI